MSFMKSKKSMQNEKALALIGSAFSYIAIVLALYNAFIYLDIDYINALLEAMVIASTIVTMVILYLFGRIWKRELGIR